jgi:hypothetical protein
MTSYFPIHFFQQFATVVGAIFPKANPTLYHPLASVSSEICSLQFRVYNSTKHLAITTGSAGLSDALTHWLNQ